MFYSDWMVLKLCCFSGQASIKLNSHKIKVNFSTGGFKWNAFIHKAYYLAIPKKKQRRGVGLVKDMEFQGYWSNFMRNFQGSIEKEVEFPGLLQKNSCGISMGIGFWTWNFEGMSHNFAEFPWVKVCSEISKVKVANLKTPGCRLRKVYPHPPPLFGFFLE